MQDVIKGKYQIVREIARSNDIVFEATDTTLGRRIALKELNLAQGLTGQAKRERIERFTREARAAGRLSHPNIVSVFDYGEENGRYFIAMEFLEGQTLRDRMAARGAFSLKEALDIIYQVLDALAYAHKNSVVHRDIKPDNIQILPGGQVKITDFGIARLTEEPALTSNGQVFGTPSYMSPEQIEGRGIDHRSDLFSAGVVLYEMIAGRKPFIGDSVVSITYAIMNQDTPPLPGVPMGIEQVVRRSLSKNPLQRQNSAEQMKLDLKAAEQTPAAFLPPQNNPPTYMGQQGIGGYNAPNYPAGNTGYNSPPQGYAPPPPLMGYNNPPAANNNLSGQPWAWSGGQNPMPPNPTGLPPVFTPAQNPTGLPPGVPSIPGFNPQNAPPFSPHPREPLIVLSPGAKMTLTILGVTALLAAGLGFGIVAFNHGYEKYRVDASSQQVAALMKQGLDAYNNHQYDAAAKQFERARDVNRSEAERANILHNLTSSYIQLGNQAADRRDWRKADEYYTKAESIAPDDLADLAKRGRANALQQLGDSTAASQERSGVSHDADPRRVPDKLDNPPPTAAPPLTPEDVVAPARKAAQKLIAEGDRLWQAGDTDGAKQKYYDAIAAAGGEPERDIAKDRLDRLNAAPSAGGG